MQPSSYERTKSQPQRVVEGVSQRIHTGALKPGDRVPSEPQIMKEFGVSRTVVREAMSRMQASGLVETRQGVGTFVLAPPQGGLLLAIKSNNVKLHQVFAMLELRISLESEAASLAAIRRQETHLQSMRTALDAFEAHRLQGLSTLEDDFCFHSQVAAATGNEYFEEVLKNLGNTTIVRNGPAQRFGDPQPVLEPDKGITHDEHHAVFEAIERRDAAAARSAMFIHLTNSRDRLQKLAGTLESRWTIEKA